MQKINQAQPINGLSLIYYKLLTINEEFQPHRVGLLHLNLVDQME